MPLDARAILMWGELEVSLTQARVFDSPIHNQTKIGRRYISSSLTSLAHSLFSLHHPQFLSFVANRRSYLFSPTTSSRRIRCIMSVVSHPRRPTDAY
jgi:hypothetical protein